MDIFVEQIVKKKFGAKDYLAFAAASLATLILTGLSIMFAASLSLLVFAALCAADYYFMTSRNLEFEYSITDGDITIDKIIYRRKRKRMISVDAHAVSEMGKYNLQALQGKDYSARIFAAAADSGEGSWYFVAHHSKMGTVLVVFDPEEKVLSAIRPFLPRQVAVNAFGRN
jgi:hypothetical protein